MNLEYENRSIYFSSVKITIASGTDADEVIWLYQKIKGN